jgi:hypothetical protein
MKISTPILSLVGCLTFGLTLSSCVDPYAGGPQQSVTSYQAGYEVRSLPSGYRTQMIDGNRYYTHNGNYYQNRSGRYIIVEEPRQRYDRIDYRRDDRREDRRDYHDDRRESHRGDRRSSDDGDGRRDVIIRRLPSGYVTETRRGTRYYRANGTYYQQSGNCYIIVQSPR